MKNGDNGNGNGDWLRRVLEKIEDHMHRIDNAVASGERRHAENEERWRKLEAYIKKNEERWQKNEERWQKNDAKWTETDRRWKLTYKLLVHAVEEIRDIKKSRS